MADKIQVAVRVRPVLFQKKDVEVHWACEQGMVFQIEPGTKKRIGNPYLFDQVFGTETQNYKIFTALVQPLIDSAMNGFNVTVLAYGQTASGKTYTMMGSQKELGIVQLVVERIFTLIEQNPERAFLLRCSYIEIYNESISDLLSSNHQKLKVQELAEGHVVVHNLIETNVNTPDAVLKLMQQGNKQRKVGGTSMNERSSRSHTIFRIIIESVPRDEADRSDAAVIVSHINLVDLAGSEKASQTNATGDRFREGCAINTSLSALSLVIKQLSEGEGFVNFRDSKLTHILRASLGGNARTAIICNVTPTVLDETSSTLKFACSAKAVQNQPHVNEVLSDQALLRKYNNYIKDLEKKLKEKECEKRPEALEEMQRLLQEKDMKINELKEQLVVSSCSEFVSGRPEDGLTAAQRSLRRMTWGGNRLKQLNFAAPAIFESTPLFPRTASHFSSRQRISNLSGSEMTLDEIAGDSDSIDSETFLPAEMVFSKLSDPVLPSVISVAKVDVATMTDVAESPFKLPGAPCTPVPVLRERVTSLRMTLMKKEKENEDLREELEDLTNFTRLEQQIGVHAQATAKHAASPETADQLHRAMQTANDMEVLYLDTQRKLSELQTEYRNKEVEHESEITSQRTDFQHRLDTELNEKKRLAKELSEIKEKIDRLEKDQSEADIHLEVITERYTKRESDLRLTLQEAWSQLELLGQDPKAIQDNLAASQRVAEVEKELLEMNKRNNEAQSRIDFLTEELRQSKESARNFSETVHKDDQMHDNSLNGMCLADELRDVFSNQECSFVTRTLPRIRKRPSSILSVALAKMDQSTCMLDSTEHEIEPSKKTRLSIQSLPTEELDFKEVKEIREHLFELQAVLERYEADFEVLSQEKEMLNDQLLDAQKELRNLRAEENKTETSIRREESKSFDKPTGTSEEVFDSSCFMGEASMSASMMDMDQTAESEYQFSSLRDQLLESSESSPGAKVSDAAALRMQKVDESNKRKQELEEELAQMVDKFNELEKEFKAKTDALEQSSSALEVAKAEICDLEQACHTSRLPCEDLVALESEWKDALLRVSQLESSLQEKVAEATILAKNLQAAEARIHLLENDKSARSTQCQSLERNIDELSAQKLDLNNQIDQLQSDLQSKEEELVDMRSMADRIPTLEVQLVQSEGELANLHRTIDEKTHQIRLLEEVVQANESQHNGQEQLHVDNSELDQLRNSLEVIRKSNDDLMEQLKDKERHNVELLKNLDDSSLEFNKRQHKFKEELAQMVDRLSEVQKDVDVKTASLEESFRLLQTARSEVAELTQALERSSSALEVAKTEISDLEEACRTSRLPGEDLGALESEWKDALSRVSQLESSIKEKAAEATNLAQNLEAAEARIHFLENDDLARSTQFQSFERSIDELSSQKINLAKQIDQLQSDLQSKEEELVNMRSMADRIPTLEVQLVQSEGELANLRRTIDEKIHKIRLLEEEVFNANENQRNGQEQLQHAEQRFREHQTELDQLRNTLESMQSANNDLIKQLGDKERLNEEVLKNLDDTTHEFNKMQQKLKEELAQMVDRLSEVQKDVDVKTTSLEESLRSLETSRSEVAELTRALERSSSELKVAKAEMCELEQTCRTSRVPREDLVALESEWKEALLRVSQLEASVEEKTSKLNISIQNLEAAQARICVLENTELAHSSQVQSLECNIEELSTQKMSLSKEVEQLKFHLQRKEEELVNVPSMTERISTLEARLVQSAGEIANLSRIIDEKTHQTRLLEEELVRANESQHNRQEQLQHVEQKFRERQAELEQLQNSLDAMQRANDHLVGQLSEKENVNGDLLKNLENNSQRFNTLHAKFESVQSEKSALTERVRSLESELEFREQEIGDLRGGLDAIQNERELTSILKQRLNSLQAQFDASIGQCQQLREVRDELLEHQERSRQEISELSSRLQSLGEVKEQLEQNRLHFEAQRESILHDYQSIKQTLTETENQLHVTQGQRDEFCNQVRVLSEQIGEVRAKATALETSSKYQSHCKMEETIEMLKRELVDARSKGEILRLNFETEEDNRKKKIERLEKELESVKKEYVKCKEQLRLFRHRPIEEGTISLPKHRVSVTTESVYAQTDPIADKGFGFRWQMEQYVSDNERLRKKVSEVGERMEYYKEKLIKYRNMYYATTGQDPNQRPLSSTSNTGTQQERHSSTSSNQRENVSDCQFSEMERNSIGKSATPSPLPSISPLPPVVKLQEQHCKEELKPKTSTVSGAAAAPASARWPGVKKDSLTKEEMEKIGNCNPS